MRRNKKVTNWKIKKGDMSASCLDDQTLAKGLFLNINAYDFSRIDVGVSHEKECVIITIPAEDFNNWADKCRQLISDHTKKVKNED